MEHKPISTATPTHLGWSHPLAEVAARHCFAHTGSRGFGIGRVACGRCWELAIRDDERVAVEHELPRELTADPDHLDEVAVRLACKGERVALTPVERTMAAHRMYAAGVPVKVIAQRLRMSHGAVVALVAPAAGQAADAELVRAA